MSSSKDEPLNYRNPSSSSSPINDSDTNSYLIDHTVPIGSASGSFQSDSLLGGDGTGGGSGSNSDIEFGFMRPDFRQEVLVGTVDYYERHVFLCYKNPRNWPPRIEAAEFDRLPRLLAAALSARKGDMKKETQLTICEGHDGSETSNGDVLIFPDMIRYRRLTHFDVDTFVEEVLVKDGEWLPGTPERLKGVYVFVCCHGSRDRRCGVCGPPLVSRFREEVDLLGLTGKVSISPCSHIGGHKYAGNVIIFGSKVGASVIGHWYGYVTPDDIPALLEQHIKRGKIVEDLWRGQMGLTEEGQKKAQELRVQNYDGTSGERSLKQPSQLNEINGSTCSSQFFAGCCQGDRNGACCLDTMSADKDDFGTTSTDADVAIEKKSKKQSFPKHGIKGGGSRKVCAMPTWLETWEREDTYAAVAVICAAVSVGVAYSYYKQLT